MKVHDVVVGSERGFDSFEQHIPPGIMLGAKRPGCQGKEDATLSESVQMTRWGWAI